MKLYSFKQIEFLEKKLIEDYDYKPILLMENAANSISDLLLKLFEGDFEDFEPAYLNEYLFLKYKKAYDAFIKNTEITFIIGSGNNGADALAVARKICIRKNYKVNLLLMGSGKTELRLYQQKLLENINFKNLTFYDFSIEDSNRKSKISEILTVPFIIDGVTGIGLKAPLNENLIKKIEFIEEYKGNDSFVISIDLPSGTTDSSSKILKSDICLMLQWAKAEFFYVENRKYCISYRILPCDMGIDNFNNNINSIELIQPENIKNIIKRRDFFSNKGNFGKVFIISASLSTLGAPLIASKASFKSGAGYVYLYIDEKFEKLCKTTFPYIITIPYKINSDKTDFISRDFEIKVDSKENQKVNSKDFEKQFKDTVIIGTGFGIYPELFFKILSKIVSKKINIIIDGDGLNIISQNFEKYVQIIKNKTSKIVFTPHKKEFERLFDSYLNFVEKNSKDNFTANFSDNFDKNFNKNIDYNQKNFLDKGKILFSSNYIDGLLMKDYISFFIGKKGIYCNNGCFSGFAKAGTGDFIAGVFASLISNYDIDDAAKILLALQDRIALDLYNKKVSVESVITENLIEQLEYSIKSLYHSST
ncbi:MAG: NAD(P)H-hydrate epimerase [Exilispira sp.]